MDGCRAVVRIRSQAVGGCRHGRHRRKNSRLLKPGAARLLLHFGRAAARALSSHVRGTKVTNGASESARSDIAPALPRDWLQVAEDSRRTGTNADYWRACVPQIVGSWSRIF